MASIKYIVRSRKNPIDKTSKFYAISAPHELVTEEEIIEQISQKSTLSRGDIMNVLSALREEIRHNLCNGRKVKLNDIGTFRTSLHSSGVNTESEFNTGLITHCRVIFTPSRAIMRAVKPATSRVTFTNAESKPSQQSESDGGVG